jgi:hypothetical protein
MPTRYLKPGIRDSESIDSLSPLAEVLFYRLLVTVDDFGRFDARATLIKAHCFPVRESVTSKDCAALLDELQAKGLVTVYTVDGKPYLQMQKWDNKPRAGESKYPQPPIIDQHLHTNVCKPNTNLPLTVTVTETETVTKTKTETQTKTAPDGDGGRFARFWEAYPKKVGKGDAERAWKKVAKPSEALDGILEALRWQRMSRQWMKDGGQYIPNPATYLNQRRWEDEPENTQAALDAQNEAQIQRLLGATS